MEKKRKILRKTNKLDGHSFKPSSIKLYRKSTPLSLSNSGHFLKMFLHIFVRSTMWTTVGQDFLLSHPDGHVPPNGHRMWTVRTFATSRLNGRTVSNFTKHFFDDNCTEKLNSYENKSKIIAYLKNGLAFWN